MALATVRLSSALEPKCVRTSIDLSRCDSLHSTIRLKPQAVTNSRLIRQRKLGDIQMSALKTGALMISTKAARFLSALPI